MKKTKNIILFGLGQHSRRTYWPFLEKLKKEVDLEVGLVVDLANEKEVIDQYLKSSTLRPKSIFYLDNCSTNIPEKLSHKLDLITKNKDRELKIIISTEPKYHKMYLDWASQNQLETLVEKPILVYEKLNESPQNAQRIYEYVKSLVAKDKLNSSSIHVQCQRRYNSAYRHAFSYTKNFITEFQVPMSHISIEHTDGMWNSLNEFMKREKHPYKYGYGKIMHSGYHYLDLFSYFFGLNFCVKDFKTDSFSVFTQIFRPFDLFSQLGTKYYPDFREGSPLKNYKHLGETDVFNLIQFKKDGQSLLTGNISLQQNTVSERSKFDKIESEKKKMGTIKSEKLRVNIGPLLQVTVKSIGKKKSKKAHERYSFVVEILRNSRVVGGKKRQIIKFDSETVRVANSSFGLSLNQAGRFKLLKNFLIGKENISKIESHLLTNLLISKTYENICKINSEEIPYSEGKYENTQGRIN